VPKCLPDKHLLRRYACAPRPLSGCLKICAVSIGGKLDSILEPTEP